SREPLVSVRRGRFGCHASRAFALRQLRSEAAEKAGGLPVSMRSVMAPAAALDRMAKSTWAALSLQEVRKRSAITAACSDALAKPSLSSLAATSTVTVALELPERPGAALQANLDAKGSVFAEFGRK